jgi:hypothetical protein
VVQSICTCSIKSSLYKSHDLPYRPSSLFVWEGRERRPGNKARLSVAVRSCVRGLIVIYVHMQEVSLYKATQDMEYLDMVVQEALRLYSPAPQ